MQVGNGYDYLGEFDCNMGYIMNPPLNTNIEYEEAYMGGTCLVVE